MEVYECEMMGKKLKYVVSKNGKYVYKQRKLSLNDWIMKIVKVLIKSNYGTKEIQLYILQYIINGWYVNENFYIKPNCIIQNINELNN
jgi:hypothetical protein